MSPSITLRLQIRVTQSVLLHQVDIVEEMDQDLSQGSSSQD